MSSPVDYHVHLGFWTNWSYGKVNGATLTLTRLNGGLLIAFIAIFIGAAGKSFWRISCFLLHRMLSSSRPQDGIYHQLQAVLRNSDTAQDAAWSLGQVIWAWRVPARFRNPFPRLIAILTLAILISVSFGVAGVFSSHITTDTVNEVLLTGNNCGPLKGNDVEDPEGYNLLFEPLNWRRVTTYSNYALQCYSGNVTAGAEDCHPYIKAKLKTTVTRNASCPFASEMCKSQNENLIVDTGYLDSNDDLGINAPPKNRFQMRLIHQCAPIVTKGFSSPFLANDTDEETMRYYYGPYDDALNNYTQEMPMLDSGFNIYNKSTRRPYRTRPRADYGINIMKAYAGSPYIANTFSDFTPIEQLHRDDADVMLFFLSARGIVFAQPVDDPWFSAHREGPKSRNVMSGVSSPTYLQDEPVQVLGCTYQMQYCNPNYPDHSRCSPLAGYVDDRVDVTQLYDNEAQKRMFNWTVDVFQLGFFSISGIVDSMGVSSLVGRQGLSANQQGPLPSNQWQTEVEHWTGGSLASIQGSFVEMGNGPPSPVYQRFRKAPENAEQKQVCKSMKIMTTKYSSFSVLGVSLILLLGGLIMLLDLTLEPIFDYFSARRSKTKSNPSGTYARLEWNANTTLQLQRLAHEHIGVGTWSSRGWMTHPVTSPGEKLAIIDMNKGEQSLFIRPEDWEGSEKPRQIPSLDVESWDEEEIRKAHASDPKIRVVRRSATFDTIGSADTVVSTMQKARRVDTTTTLVNEALSDEEDDVIKTKSHLGKEDDDLEMPVPNRFKSSKHKEEDQDEIGRAP